MALHEERGEQYQQNWDSRIARERQDLSASVEEALADTDEQGREWRDDEQNFPGATTSGTPLVPPRLSLQSRAMPTVQPAGPMNASTSEHSSLLPDVSGEIGRRSPLPSGEVRPQSTSMLARLAQRFTSSFVAIGGSTKATPRYQQEASKLETPFPQEARQVSPINHIKTAMTRDHAETPLVRVVDTAPSATDAETLPSSTRGQVRSLRGNAKIRLETTVLPAMPKTPTTRFDEQETGEELRSAEVRDALDWQQVAIMRREEARPISPSPILEMFEGELGVAARGSLSGKGTFECGQSDVTIPNARVTTSSVVQVTLTSNPGPVVVQYISLQPQTGFTVHLTAPTATRTTFNYIILLGELF